MKKSIFWLLLFFVILTTYTPRFDTSNIPNLLIKKIIIYNNSIIKTENLKKKLSFLYNKNLFFLKSKDLEDFIISEKFIKSFSLKRIYPSTLKIKIIEKKPIAIIQNKKKKFYITETGDLIDFKEMEPFQNLPIVFGNGEKFYFFLKDLQEIKFPIEEIKSFYVYETQRWDIILKNNKTIKLPISGYKKSLRNFLKSRLKSEFDNYKIFDYRIKDQLILN
tara:strand:+ start:15811 stop:16470 length:660 start_codon:yes stop_codon:yes gene_type:complete